MSARTDPRSAGAARRVVDAQPCYDPADEYRSRGGAEPKPRAAKTCRLGAELMLYQRQH